MPGGAIHQQVAEAASERELRDRFTQQGFLIYWRSGGGLAEDGGIRANSDAQYQNGK